MKKSLVQIASGVSRITAVPTARANIVQQRNLAFKKKEPMSRYQKLADSAAKKPRVLITGAMGQLGRGLASVYRYMYGRESVLMTDIVKAPLDGSVEPFRYLNILDQNALEETVVNSQIDVIVHYSALLSAVGENNVPLALAVNGKGVENVLEVGRKYNLQVFIPSTIGAFGPTSPLELTPDICIQRPRTIYGVTKVYAELLGEYYNDKFGLDFRCLRYPGIISATMPGGGTTDYAVQAFYDALMYGKHKCYLKPNTRLPMMYDTDCTGSTVFFLASPAEKLKQRTYNVTGFSLTPEELTDAIRKVMPNFQIEYEICPVRQKIAESWPDRSDDSNARKDWGWEPEYDLDATVEIMFDLVGKQLAEQKTTGAPKTAASM
uniref:L-threonine 3-dehydrogenase, mitochondrial n=1 Tax=Ascaris lumbricoides TaxID=6252 RepID=A0A9J2PD70_ASCLU